jgi:hypothetical protein
MNLDELVVTIGAKIEHGDFQDVFAVIDHVKEAFEKVGEAIKSAFEKGFEVTDKVATEQAAILRLADSYGLAESEVEQLGWAAKASGTSLESLMQGMKFLAKNAGDAAKGGGEAAQAFSGIATKDTQGKVRGMGVLLEDVADKIANLPKGAERVNLARQLFGRGGDALIPLLSQGRKGIEALREQFEASGAALAEVYSEMTPAYERAKKVSGLMTEALETRFAGRNIEKQTHLWDSLTKILSSKGIQRAVDMLSRAFGALVDGLTKAGDALAKFLNGPIGRMEFILFAVAAAFTGMVAAAVVAAVPMIASGLAVAASWALAALPFLAIGALLVLLVDEIYTFIEGGDSMLGRLQAWAAEIDPNDNLLLKALKEWVTTLMNLGDPANWARVKNGILEAMGPLKELAKLLGLVSDALGFAGKVGTAVKGAYTSVDTSLKEHGLGSLNPEEQKNPMTAPMADTGATVDAIGTKTMGWFERGLSLLAGGGGVVTPRGGATSPTAAIQGPPGMPGVSAPTPAPVASTPGVAPVVSSTVNVTVPAGSDAHAIGAAVKTAVDERLGHHLQTAYAAHGGGK